MLYLSAIETGGREQKHGAETSSRAGQRRKKIGPSLAAFPGGRERGQMPAAASLSQELFLPFAPCSLSSADVVSLLSWFTPRFSLSFVVAALNSSEPEGERKREWGGRVRVWLTFRPYYGSRTTAVPPCHLARPTQNVCRNGNANREKQFPDVLFSSARLPTDGVEVLALSVP